MAHTAHITATAQHAVEEAATLYRAEALAWDLLVRECVTATMETV